MIASVEATESTVGDSVMLVPLLASSVARGFNVKELSADKAYLSNGNLTAVESVGAVPYVVREQPRLWEHQRDGAGCVMAKSANAIVDNDQRRSGSLG